MDAAYAPLNRLKQICDDIWIVDGPTIRYGIPLLKFPFPTRMTIVRIGRDLFVHSPTTLTAGLIAELKAIGRPRWLVGPNRLHYWWISDWKRVFSDADVYLAPRVEAQASGRIDFAYHELGTDDDYPWDARMETLPVNGSYMTEIVFFERTTRTLILTDLIENFEPARLRSRLTRWLTRIGGVQDPHGSMPRDMRLTFSRQRPELKAAIERMIAWAPDRVILAHGRWYDENGTEELGRAFRWLLD